MGVVEKSVIASSVRLRLERENRCAHWQSSSLAAYPSFFVCVAAAHTTGLIAWGICVYGTFGGLIMLYFLMCA